jgi:AraC family ethanolamine operon transcriptional activator
VFEGVYIAVDGDFFERYSGSWGVRPIRAKEGAAPLVCTKHRTAVARFERMVMQTVGLLAENPSLLQNAQTRHALQKSVLDSLCESLLAEAPEDDRLPCSSTRAYIVEKATRFIEAHLGDLLTVHDIAKAVRVCPRTLRYSFEHVLGVTPCQYIRAKRLNKVRRDLLAGRQESVQAAATRWGFWHMGRFSQYYRRTFGELPSRTLHKDAARLLSGDEARDSAPQCGALPQCFYSATRRVLAEAQAA